jgi:hypothetical protein
MSTHRRPARRRRPSSDQARGAPSAVDGAGRNVCPDWWPAFRLSSPTGPRLLSEMCALPRLEPVRWYGSSPHWRIAVEAQARRHYGPRLHAHLAAGRLTYTVDLDVPGRIHPVPVMISFYDTPPYYCYRLPPVDYPRVHAEPGAASPHRMPDDDAMCLWYPADPHERRWTANKGLLDLLDIITSHLLYEAHSLHRPVARKRSRPRPHRGSSMTAQLVTGEAA